MIRAAFIRLLAWFQRRRQHAGLSRAARRQRRSKRLDVVVGSRPAGVLRRHRTDDEIRRFHHEREADRRQDASARGHRRRHRWADRRERPRWQGR